METIIKKAIEGGYGKRHAGYLMAMPSNHTIVLDPLFWQALGKSCGWENEIEEVAWIDKGAYRDSSIIDGFYNDLWKLETWKFHAIQFHRVNLTEGWDKAVAYLEDLNK